jgi:hypothetical protein
MPKVFEQWTVLHHGPIEKLAENLWRVAGSIPHMSLRRVMTMARLGDGRLVIHSAIALEQAAMREVEGWGTPSFLVVPGEHHRLDALAYKKRYPALRTFTPRGARPKIEPYVSIDGTYEEFPSDPSVRLERIAGIDDVEGAMIVRSSDGATVVLNDVVFNMDRKFDPLGFFFTTLFGSAPGPRISRLFKAWRVRDRVALRRDLERLAETPELTRLIVAHDKVALGREQAKRALQVAASYL